MSVTFLNSGNVNGTPLFVPNCQPLDAKCVVQTRADLVNDNCWTWFDENDPYADPDEEIELRYAGMIVTVIADSISTNNGVYYLKSLPYKNCFVVANENETQNNNGWVKLDSGNNSFNIDQYTIKDGYNTALDSDVVQEGLHVVRVDGGIF